ncbi:MAG: hypothetical protein A3J24_11345 [Deltaproteobacteria bacterium RIFCSPLOWO2_02_FULL_53_8]|nr:MAG: hypothetical protein A3J24_11345 [Deltaproteobacteria bacterium RIFCSPLOWO2_02_FULL_53_8]
MSVLTTISSPRKFHVTRAMGSQHREETIITRVWIDEYAFLQTLYNCAENCSPKFRLPDLISACVSLIFLEPDPAAHIFSYLNTTLVLRNPDTARRQERIWKPQYELLLALQKSAANAHPNPQFKLDQFTTACIALVLPEADAKRRIFEQARKNTAARAASREPPTHANQ